MQDMPNFVIHYLDSCDVLWNCSAYIFFCKIMKYPHYMTQCAITENLFSKKFFFMKMSWFHVLFFCEKVVRVNFQNFHTVYENLDTHRVRQLLHNVVHIRPENFPLKKKKNFSFNEISVRLFQKKNQMNLYFVSSQYLVIK